MLGVGTLLCSHEAVSGWQVLDDIRVKKLELGLKAVLGELGQPDPAEALISKR